MNSSPQRYSSNPRERETSNSKEYQAGSHEGMTESQYTSKLLGTKAAAKETEREAITLRNRIALLEKEEQKVLKKIEGAKNQALDIMSKKQRNNKIQEQKERAMQEQQAEIEAKRHQINSKKDEMTEKVKEAATEVIIASKEKANEIKENLRVVFLLSEIKGEVQRTGPGGIRPSSEPGDGYKETRGDG